MNFAEMKFVARSKPFGYHWVLISLVLFLNHVSCSALQVSAVTEWMEEFNQTVLQFQVRNLASINSFVHYW